MLTISGAYGRDYKSKAAIVADIADGKDFVCRDLANDGRYCSPLEDFAGQTVQVRYQRDRKVAVFNLSDIAAGI